MQVGTPNRGQNFSSECGSENLADDRSAIPINHSFYFSSSNSTLYSLLLLGPTVKFMIYRNVNFLRMYRVSQKKVSLNFRKWPYLSPWASNQKTKGNFFSPTLKVKEKKVSLFFSFEAQGMRFGQCLLSTIARWQNNVGKS